MDNKYTEKIIKENLKNSGLYFEYFGYSSKMLFLKTIRRIDLVLRRLIFIALLIFILGLISVGFTLVYVDVANISLNISDIYEAALSSLFHILGVFFVIDMARDAVKQ